MKARLLLFAGLIVVAGVAMALGLRELGGAWEVGGAHLVRVPVIGSLREIGDVLYAPDLAASRLRAIEFVTTPGSGAAKDLADLLALEELKNVVVSGRVAGTTELHDLLEGAGFERVLRRPSVSLFVR